MQIKPRRKQIKKKNKGEETHLSLPLMKTRCNFRAESRNKETNKVDIQIKKKKQ